MKRLFALILLTMALGATSAFSQPFQVTMGYLSGGTNTPLTTTCGGATPLPDGRVIKLFWDTDSDGPDATDPIAPLCSNPPDCETGPAGTLNINQWTTNGVSIAEGAGYWYTLTSSINSAQSLPSPSRFYVRIYEADGTTVLWTSIAYTFVSGPQDIATIRADWTCGASGPQCIVVDEHE
jgi:hypothetical protein